MMSMVYRAVLRKAAAVLVIGFSLLLASCGGTKVLDEPRLLVVEQSLKGAADAHLEAHLDWVIVRDGPGTWARSADWDEYVLRVRNLSADPVRITGVAVYDSLGTRLEASANLDHLIAASRRTARRYENEGIAVTAGMGGTSLMAAGTVALVGGEALGTAVLAGSAGAGAAGVAIGAIVLAPVLIVGGAVKSKNKDKVARQIVDRHTPLPVDLDADETQSMSVFFPLAPSPLSVELTYDDFADTRRLDIDTREILRGLHIDSAGRCDRPARTEQCDGD